MNVYLVLKHIHVATVAVSGGLFLLRGWWMIRESPRLQERWVRVVPHVNDTVLLASAVTLAVLAHQYPLLHGWLTAKVVALIFYIGLGTVALKRGATKAIRAWAFVAALVIFGYIISVALSRNPWGFLVVMN